MFTTIALAAALSLGQAESGELTVVNIRNSFGLLGSTRPDTKFVPGDLYCVGFDIDNVKVTDTGEVIYSMGMEVVDSKGKTLYKQDPRELKALNSTGGSRLPCFAHVIIGLDQPPGEYTLKVAVSDRSDKKAERKASFERKFDVLPRAFGLVRLTITADSEARVAAPPIGAPGQSLWVNFFAVGFERDASKKDADVGIEMQVFDENDKPTVEKPFKGQIRNLPADVAAVPMAFAIALNRPGKFTVKLKATDHVAKKTSELSFPLTVTELK